MTQGEMPPPPSPPAPPLELEEIKTTKYADKVYPLTEDEYRALKQSIAENGLYRPIVINRHGDVLDGHHRLKACRQLGIEPTFEVLTKPFANELLEELYVIDTNLIRRQLNDYQRGKLVLKKKPLLEELAKKNMSLGGKGDKILSPLERVSTQLANQANMSREQLRKIEQISKFEQALPEHTKVKLNAGEVSIDSVYKTVKQIQDDNKPNDNIDTWAKNLEGKTDLEQFAMFGKGEYQNDTPRIYNVWNFTQPDPRLGQKHPGQIPGQIAMNVLYYYTEQGDIVVDPMAGGGSTIDACKIMNRRCVGYDIEPKRQDIQQWDVTKGLHPEARNCDMVFLDPPYWNIMKEQYSPDSISSASLEDFMKFLEKLAKDCWSALKDCGHVALVIEGLMDDNWEYIQDFPVYCINIFRAVGFKERQRISVPLSTQVKSALDVARFKKKKQMLTLNRDLIIFQKQNGGGGKSNDI